MSVAVGIVVAVVVAAAAAALELAASDVMFPQARNLGTMPVEAYTVFLTERGRGGIYRSN